MSFIVSYNGQFRPYKLPDLSHYDRIHHTYAAKKNKKLEDHEDDDFEVELGAAQLKSKELNKKRTAIGSYEKVDKFHQQHKVPYLARHLMSTPVDCLKDTDTLGTLLEHMQKYDYRHFPVVDEKSSLVGIVTDRDVIRVINKEKSTKLSDFMSKEVLTALDSTRIQDIAKIMLHEKINCLPIITDDHVIVGIITQTNILNYVIQSYPLATSS